MRLLGVLLVACVSVRAPALDQAEAVHLLWRTGFGPTPDSIAELLPMTRAEAVAHVLTQLDAPDVAQALAWTQRVPEAPDRAAWKKLPEPERRALFREMREERQKRGRELRMWYWGQLSTTQTPLVERLTLFWHDHFTSELQVVKEPWLLWQQQLVIREHLDGSFADMLTAMTTDGAMLVYLDGGSNKRGRPNENFARELFELFTLGEGHYSEDDITEAARALTGWRLNREVGEARFVERNHDTGDKTVFGQTGAFGSDDILALALAQERTAVHLVERFWLSFVADSWVDADRPEIERLAGVLRDNNYAMRPFLAELFVSDAFWGARGQLVKSPVDLAVAAARMLGPGVLAPLRLDRGTTAMGQKLFDPPGVQGWPDGAVWLDSASLLLRWQLLEQVARVATRNRGPELTGWLGPIKDQVDQRDMLAQLLLAVPAVGDAAAADAMMDMNTANGSARCFAIQRTRFAKRSPSGITANAPRELTR